MTVPAVVLAVALAVVAGGVWRSGRLRSGWPWFLAWTATGAVCALASVSMAIGLLVLPFALAAVLAVGHLAFWPEVLGLPAGVGAFGVYVGVAGRGGSGWTVVGTLLVVAAVAAYGTAGLRRQPAAPRVS